MKIVMGIDTTLITDPLKVAELASHLLDVVTEVNREYMRSFKGRIPPLLKSGLEWRQEPWAGVFEEFADCLTALSRGWLDCDDAVPYRRADLAEYEGESSSNSIYYRENPRKPHFIGGAMVLLPPTYTYHVQVRRGNGTIEDVSRLLGM